MTGQLNRTNEGKIGKTILVAAFFLCFSAALRFAVYAELKICTQCKVFEIYDPMVIADATLILFVILGLTHLVFRIRAFTFWR